jgi:hypothetical protein
VEDDGGGDGVFAATMVEVDKGEDGVSAATVVEVDESEDGVSAATMVVLDGDGADEVLTDTVVPVEVADGVSTAAVVAAVPVEQGADPQSTEGNSAVSTVDE